MNKWIIVLVACAAAAGAAVFVLSPKTSEDGGSSETSMPVISESKVTPSEVLSYVPADTVFYFGGTNSKELAEFMQGSKILGSTPSQIAVMEEAMSSMAEGGDKTALFFKSLYSNLIENTDGSFAEVVDFYGGSMIGSYAFYADGIVPVLRMPINDATKLFAQLDKVSAESGLTPEAKVFEGKNLKMWTLNEDPAVEKQVKLIVADLGEMVVVTLMAGNDSDDALKKRLGFVKPEKSLADSGEIKQLQTQYKYTNDFIFSVNIVRIAQGFLDPENSEFGKGLLHYFSEPGEGLDIDLTPECKADYANIFAKVPRIVGGYSKLDVNGNRLEMDFETLSEIKNPVVTQELMKIRGHIPEHALSAQGKLFNFGFGINADTFVPAATSLWNAFISAEFTCDNLIQAQDGARQANPAMAGMFLGMVQGLKGIGASVFDLEMDMQTMMPSKVSAMVSATAENPQTIAAMASMVPFLAGLQIPADGSAVDLALPMLPPSVSLKAAIKGKQIVIYTEGSEAQLEGLASEGTEGNGLYSFGLDYRKFSSMTDNLVKLGGDAAAAQGKVQNCASKEELKEMLKMLNMDFSVIIDITEKGNVMKMTGSMDKFENPKPNIAGTFNVDTFDEQCQWVELGVNQLRADGTGSYQEKSSDGECILYSSNFTWKKKGPRIVFSITDAKERDTCSGQWQAGDAMEQTCYLFGPESNGFKCLYDPGEDPTAQRYTQS